MVDQAIASGVDGIVIQHGLPESMTHAAQRAVDAGIEVVAFDVNVDNPKIPQIEQSDRDLARLALEQALEDNGSSFVAGYVYVPGIAPLDRRNETWEEVKKANPGIRQVAEFGTFDNPIADSVAKQARAVLLAHPEITVMFAPYDEFGRGVKIAVDEVGMSGKVSIYSADISTHDIQSMREPDSAWKATAAANPVLDLRFQSSCTQVELILFAGKARRHRHIGNLSRRRNAASEQKGPRCVRELWKRRSSGRSLGACFGDAPGRGGSGPPCCGAAHADHSKGTQYPDIENMADLAAKVPAFAHVDVAVPVWMPLPSRPNN